MHRALSSPLIIASLRRAYPGPDPLAPRSCCPREIVCVASELLRTPGRAIYRGRAGYISLASTGAMGCSSCLRLTCGRSVGGRPQPAPSPVSTMKQHRSRRATRVARLPSTSAGALPLRWGCGASDTDAYRQVSLDHWLLVAQPASLACRHWFRRTTLRRPSESALHGRIAPSPPIPSVALASVADLRWRAALCFHISQLWPSCSIALVDRFPFPSRCRCPELFVLLLLLLRAPSPSLVVL